MLAVEKEASIMTYSVNVTNSSGAPQNVAIFLADASDINEFSLVWLVTTINNGGNYSFKWDQTDFGLGWGNTSQPVDIGVLFTSGQSPTSVSPTTANSNNALPVQHNNNGFFSGTPYLNPNIHNKLEITTDASFTVSASLTMSVALYVAQYPALVMQGAPNTRYYFDIAQISYYLTVTDLAQGVMLPKLNTQLDENSIIQSKSSLSTPTKIVFGSGAMDLTYILDGTLTFCQT